MVLPGSPHRRDDERLDEGTAWYYLSSSWRDAHQLGTFLVRIGTLTSSGALACGSAWDPRYCHPMAARWSWAAARDSDAWYYLTSSGAMTTEAGGSTARYAFDGEEAMP